MTAQDAMKLLVAEELQPSLDISGFRKRALTFYRRVQGNYAVIQLQKSRDSTASMVEFTINLGVFSPRVHQGIEQYIWVPDVKKVPTEPDCHLRLRIGRLMPGRPDPWWAIGPSTDRGPLGATLRALLDSEALPFLELRTTDEGLRDHWLSCSASGPQGLALAVLLRDLGPREALRPLLDRLRAETPVSANLLVAAITKFAAQTDFTTT